MDVDDECIKYVTPLFKIRITFIKCELYTLVLFGLLIFSTIMYYFIMNKNMCSSTVFYMLVVVC